MYILIIFITVSWFFTVIISLFYNPGQGQVDVNEKQHASIAMCLRLPSPLRLHSTSVAPLKALLLPGTSVCHLHSRCSNQEALSLPGHLPLPLPFLLLRTPRKEGTSTATSTSVASLPALPLQEIQKH